ncbi:TPA: hypothetical protein G8410_004090 [Salmonella enterica]|uniref:Reverse transcriptase domain-containing protein n=1 Tax=Salmonella enterica TaxID=28901 RepID=A0A763UKK1_SALER|nr:hypothetical protein [Salmonella enterica]
MLPSQAKPSQAKPSQAKPSQAKPSQAKPSQARAGNLCPALSFSAAPSCNKENYSLYPFLPGQPVFRFHLRGISGLRNPSFIRKEQLWHHVCRFVRSPVLQNVIKQYIWYTVEHGGEFFTPQGGICRGSALSPLPGGIIPVVCGFGIQPSGGYLLCPYMDDFLFLSKRRWTLRRAVRRLHDYFEDTGFECHPDRLNADLLVYTHFN